MKLAIAFCIGCLLGFFVFSPSQDQYREVDDEPTAIVEKTYTKTNVRIEKEICQSELKALQITI